MTETEAGYTIKMISCRPVTPAWNTDTINWNNKPSYGNTLHSSNSGNALVNYTFNITGMVDAWKKGMHANNGVMFLYTNATDYDLNAFYSSDCGDSSKAPKLSVEYETSLTTPGITSGQIYYIRAAHSGKYLDARQNGSGDVVQYGFHGNTNQQWRVVSAGDGYYRIYNLWSAYSSTPCFGMETPPSEGTQMYTDGSGMWRNLWRILPNGDGTFRLMCRWQTSNNYYNQVVGIKGASTADLTQAEHYAYNSGTNQKWVFEKANSIGQIVPNTYSKVNSDITRCYPFAMYLPNLTSYLNIKNYSSGDSIRTTANNVLNHFSPNAILYNRSVREVGKNDLINLKFEYKMVLKTYTTTFLGVITGGDYHFILQCNNGTWANKLSWLNSENLGNIDPSSGSWNYGGINPNTGKRQYGEYPYDSTPIYFAVRVW